VADVHKVDNNIRAVRNAIDGKPITMADIVALYDTLSILKGIKRSPAYNTAQLAKDLGKS
jgi:hypothetical protein